MKIELLDGLLQSLTEREEKTGPMPAAWQSLLSGTPPMYREALQSDMRRTNSGQAPENARLFNFAIMLVLLATAGPEEQRSQFPVKMPSRLCEYLCGEIAPEVRVLPLVNCKGCGFPNPAEITFGQVHSRRPFENCVCCGRKL